MEQVGWEGRGDACPSPPQTTALIPRPVPALQSTHPSSMRPFVRRSSPFIRAPWSLDFLIPPLPAPWKGWEGQGRPGSIKCAKALTNARSVPPALPHTEHSHAPTCPPTLAPPLLYLLSLSLIPLPCYCRYCYLPPVRHVAGARTVHAGS